MDFPRLIAAVAISVRGIGSLASAESPSGSPRVAHSDGNPLYIEELTRSLLESQFLRDEDDRYTLVEALPPSMVPTSLTTSC